MKNLFICNTVYQIIVAIAIKKYLVDQGDTNDIIISDHMKDGSRISKEIEMVDNLFDKVFFAETKKFHYGNDKKNKTKIQKIFHRYDDDIAYALTLFPICYDNLFFGGFDHFTCGLISYCRKKCKKTVFHLFEDGLSTYSYEKHNFENLSMKNKIEDYLLKVNASHSVYSFYFFNPEILGWNPPGEIIQIPHKLGNDTKFCNVLSNIFNLNSRTDTYSEKFVFFEDGFLDYGNPGVIEIVSLLAKKIPNGNLFVKTHPRNTQNYFKSIGVRTNVDTSIPWEIIAWNIDLSSKVLITFMSQAVVMPNLLFDKNYKVLILFELLPNKNQKDIEYYEYMKEYIYSKNSKMYIIPKTLDELNTIIEKLNL